MPRPPTGVESGHTGRKVCLAGGVLTNKRSSDSLKLARLRIGSAVRTTLLYVVFGLLWIAISGAAVDMLFDDPARIVGLELAKGVAFVLVSAGLLYLLITRHAQRVLDSEIVSIERLKQSEQRFRTLVDGIHDHLIVLLNRRGEIITWNPGAETLTGYSGKQVIGKNYRVLFTEAERASGQPETLLLEASERGPVTTFGKRLRADGTILWVRSTISPVYDDDGAVTGFTKITRDLTEALEHERALEKRARQQTVIAEIGRRALSTDHVSEFTDEIVTEVGAVLRADQVMLFHATDDEVHQIAASWSRQDGIQTDVELTTTGLLQLCRQCDHLETGDQSVLDPYPELKRQGFESAAVVRFGPIGTDEWCLAALFRRPLEMDDDDRHFMSALARILQNTITREMAQREIRESESKLSMIVDQLPAILWTIDAELIVRSFTGSGLRLLGAAASESLGKRATEMVSPVAADVLKEAVHGTPGTYVIEYEDRVFRTWIEPMRSDGDLVGAIGLSIDITDQEAARRKLETSMQALEMERIRVRLFLEQMPAILWTVDRDLVIQSSVGAGLRSVGRNVDETAGRHLSEVMDSGSPVFTAMSRALDGESGDASQDYRGRIFRVHIEPLRGPDGNSIIGAIGLAIDVTEEMRVQDELVEKSRALENLSAQLIDAQESERERIARELHDELGGIFASLSFDAALIGENASAPALVSERSSEMIRRIEVAMKRVREIARDLRPKVLDDFGLVAAIEDLVASFSDRYGIETNLSSRPEEISVGKGHDIMLYRIVQEALTNVAKHAAATRAEVRLRVSDHQVIAEIRDDGRGIRPEEIIAGGSLGLVGMRERADILGGDLAIEPFEGKGTIVRVTVPLTRKEQS